MRRRVVLIALLLTTGLALAGPSREREMAKLMLREGRLDEAAKAARNAIAEDPADAAAARVLQDLLADQGEDPLGAIPEKAPDTVREYLEARILPPDRAVKILGGLRDREDAPREVSLDLARSWMDQGRPKTAEGILKDYTDAHPDDAEGFYLLAVARDQGGNPAAALISVEQALQTEPGLAEAALLAARLYRERFEPERGRALLLAGLKLYPGNDRLHYGMGLQEMAEDAYPAAEESLKKALGIRPTVAEYALRLGEIRIRTERFVEAEEAVRKALEIEPGNPEALNLLGFTREKQHDWEGALENYLAAVKNSPDTVRYHVDAGFAYLVLGKFEKAESELKLALKLDKDDLDATVKLGIVYYRQENYKEAKKYFNLALKLQKDDFAANQYMGYVLLSDGKAKDAIKFFQRAAELDPTRASPWRMIGRAWLELGKLDEAMDAFTEAIKHDQNDAWSHFDMGKGLEEKGEWDSAEESYRKAIELDPSFYHPHLYLAELLDEVKQDEAGALEQYRIYLDLGGPDPYGDVKERVKQLEKK